MSNTYGDYSRIRMLWPDHFGLARGKYLPSRLTDKGTGFCATTFGLAYDREIIDAPNTYLLEGLRDVHGMPVAESLRPAWEDDRTGVVIGDLHIDGGPYCLSSRSALERAISDWGDLGYSPKIGIELEGYLLEQDDSGEWARYANPRSMVYGTGSLGDPTGFVDDVMFAAEASGFRLESVNVEFDESQFEFTLEYDDALTAIDDAFVFRVLVREVALRRGLDFTFLGKPFMDISGSGTHINFSLNDASGTNALSNQADAQNITDLARGCLAGLVTHHNALTALLAPTVNAYRRLQPGTLAGCWANWGVDHRNVSNRIPPEAGPAMRIENRVGDGAMNLHLGAAAVLQAARLGVANELATPPAFDGVGFEEGGDDAGRCASTLEGAIDDLEADTALSAAVGQDLVDNYIVHKRHEAAQFAASGESLDSQQLTAFERAWYLPFH